MNARRILTPEIDLYAPATFAPEQFSESFLVTCLRERVDVVRKAGPQAATVLGLVPELIEHARPYLPTHPLIRALVSELEASRG